MSLSGNTEKINSLIAAINNLPNAGEGGGGSGGTAETCTVTVLLIDPETIYPYIAYQTPNGYGLMEGDGMTATYELQCLAPSILSMLETSTVPSSVIGGIEKVSGAGYFSTFYVTGDCTITWEGIG